ncbi:GAF domain-containing SpoIIE family protein phosphatase [Bacteroidota bacterium]
MKMAEITSWKKKYDLKELELNALLEITQAVNNNLPVDSLYKIYRFTLQANLKLKKLALYVKDEEFECKASYGTKVDFNNEPIDESFLQITEIGLIEDLENISPFNEFDTFIPVYHKDNLLALVFSESTMEEGHEDESTNTNFIQALTNIIIVAIENKKLFRRQKQQKALRRELKIARNVQQNLFPKELPEEGHLQLFASYLPHRSVGGDYYDYIPIDDNQFLICIADVSGKGIPAALLMSNFQASLRTMIRQTNDPEKIIHELNYQTLINGNGDHFITFFMALYNVMTREFKYVNAGHNPPYLCLDNGQILPLESGTTILGSFRDLPFLKVGCYTDLSRFCFFSYTDGLIETRNSDDEEFGTDKLKDELKDLVDCELKTIHDTIIHALDDFKGIENYIDDITIFSCRVNLITEK